MSDAAEAPVDWPDPDDGNIFKVLVLNAGSSSLKFGVYCNEENLWRERGQIGGIGTEPFFECSHPANKPQPTRDITLDQAADLVLDWLARCGFGADQVDAAGHRIVHGGSRFSGPAAVDDQVQLELQQLAALAPLHMPAGLTVLRKVRQAAPHTPNVACFDTSFHRTQPDVASRLPLPERFHEAGYRRYGFHGLSYEHVVRALPLATGQPLPRRIVAAHLGNGASMCAILEGKSIATTMGYSTADGLVMGTRAGTIDPGVLIALQRDHGLSAQDVESLLYRESGLLGLSGLSGDMRVLLSSNDPKAAFAVEHYCYWAARHAASLIGALGGLDAFVFTGGVGERAYEVRKRIVHHLRWAGLDYNTDPGAPWAKKIFGPAATAPAYVLAADEEWVIAEHVLDELCRRTALGRAQQSA